MTRFRARCYYDGSHYKGWQSQPDVSTVQDSLENTLTTVLKQSITIHGSGRTDRGVHALGQMVHFDVGDDVEVPRSRWLDVVNDRLPDTIRLYRLTKCDSSFHARHDAEHRCYGYRFKRDRSRRCSGDQRSWVLSPEEWQPSRAQWLVDRYNDSVPTSVFSGSGGSSHQSDTWPLNSWMRRRQSDEFWLLVSTRSFKYRMVRCLAGMLKQYVSGQWTKDDVNRILKHQNSTVTTAPPDGCYLLDVVYQSECRDLNTINGWNNVLTFL